MDWGTELRAFRQRTGMKQEAAAHLLGVSQAYISRLENGTAAPSEALASRLTRILKEPEHRPMFEHYRSTVTYSPHLVSMISERDGQIFVEAASQSLLEYGPPFHNVKVGQTMPIDMGAEAEEVIRNLMRVGAFAGEVAHVDVVWTYPRPEGGDQHWRIIQIPVRNDSGQWFLHVTNLPITAAEKAGAIQDWGGRMRVRPFPKDSVVA